MERLCIEKCIEKSGESVNICIADNTEPSYARSRKARGMEGVTTRPCGNNNRPTSARHAYGRRDEIVWTARRRAEAVHKRFRDNKSPYSGKLEALSKFEVRKPVMQALRNDAVKTFDRAAWAQFNNAKLRVAPTAGTNTGSLTLTTNGTCTTSNNVQFGSGHLKAIVDLMKERNVPAYTNDDYIGIAWPTTLRTLKNNLEAIHQYTVPGIQLIFNGEIGRYENTRFVEQTNVVKGYGSTDGITATAWGSGSDWIFFMGEDTVAEGVAVPEEMRAKIPTDFGRSKGIAWYYLGGFGIAQTSASESRIVVWDSNG